MIDMDDIERAVQEFRDHDFGFGPCYLDAHVRYGRFGEFAITITRDETREIHGITDYLGDLTAFVSALDNATDGDDFDNIIEDFANAHNAALEAGWGDWVRGSIILDRKRSARTEVAA